MADVTVTNKSGQTVALRLNGDSDALADIRKRVKAGQLEDVKVAAGVKARRGPKAAAKPPGPAVVVPDSED